MQKRRPTAIIQFLVVLLFVFSIPAATYGQTGAPPDPLQEGIREYQADNYEEAVELFKQARRAAPDSTTVAFWLGMAYKQQNNFSEAVAPLTDAVTKTPPLKEALVELVDILYRLERFDEAARWIAVAEKEKIYPAKTAFLKGMILTKQQKYGEAVEAFEKSKSLDKTYTQSAEFQIGLCYMLDRKYAKASDRFRAAVTQDPLSDLGSFARRYQDLVEDRQWVERPLRLTLSALGQYDTNMLTEPKKNDPRYPAIDLRTGKEDSYAMLNTLRMDVVPTLPGGWLFNASYAGTWNLHQNNATSHDMFANTLSVAPGYSFGRVAVNLAGNYTHILKRQPVYREYSQSYSVGPMVRVLFTEQQNQILELYGGYTDKSYKNHQRTGAPPLDPNEDQNSRGLDSYVSWMWLFQNGAIFNLKYGFSEDRAEGNNWTNRAHRFTVNTIVPIWKGLKLQLGGEVTLQDYLHESSFTLFDNKKRSDEIYTGTAGLTWDVNKYLSVLAQYNGTRADSNIFVYDYIRSLYSVGLEFRF
ncbi:MAG TPA: tetratricopeptide repeat protein [Syntrophales bacterium]|nr:tetratricopeptide repeat protein [Syntrophales bacterium]